MNGYGQTVTAMTTDMSDGLAGAFQTMLSPPAKPCTVREVRC
jgi:hypothetical protein